MFNILQLVNTMIKAIVILFISGLHCVFISMTPSEYDDSFILLNAKQENAPLTLFDYANKDTILPLRMATLTYDSLPYQLFKLRYDHEKNIFFSPKIDTLYGSIRNSKFLVATKKTFKPNLTLHSFSNGDRSKAYRIKSGSQCLTVGSSAVYNSTKYWKLEFDTCDNNDKNQEFIFIPHITALSYLQQKTDIDFDKRILRQVYSNLDRTLKYASQKY